MVKPTFYLHIWYDPQLFPNYYSYSIGPTTYNHLNYNLFTNQIQAKFFPEAPTAARKLRIMLRVSLTSIWDLVKDHSCGMLLCIVVKTM